MSLKWISAAGHVMEKQFSLLVRRELCGALCVKRLCSQTGNYYHYDHISPTTQAKHNWVKMNGRGKKISLDSISAVIYKAFQAE